MNQELDHIVNLIVKRFNGELTEADAVVLKQWSESGELRNKTDKELELKESFIEILRNWKTYDNSTIAEKLEKEFPGLIAEVEQEVVEKVPVHRVHFLKTTWFKYAAAILVIAGVGAYLWNTQQKEKPLVTTTKAVPVKNDIPPGSDRAVLTLSNGQQVILDRTASETIKDGTLFIENNNGQLIYKKGDMVAINTMSTPRGGQYKLTLADGTNVWLNAASSISYPTAFTNTTREVSVTGEAYFEVAKNPSKPFIVKTATEDITVLGTNLNVNAYEDEKAMKTSLLEGSVRVEEQILKPGQAYADGKVTQTDLDQDVAWKNGVFNFNNVNVQEAMRQLSRWYDIEIVYDETVNEVFIGEIGRNLTLSQVLKTIEGAGVHFKLEGKILHVFK